MAVRMFNWKDLKNEGVRGMSTKALNFRVDEALTTCASATRYYYLRDDEERYGHRVGAADRLRDCFDSTEDPSL